MEEHRKNKLFRILLAEDDIEMRKLLVWHLTENGFEVVECTDGNTLSNNLQDPADSNGPVHFDLVITDYRMPGVNGLNVLEKAIESGKCPPAILITAFPERELIERSDQLGIVVVSKPFDTGDLIMKIKEIFSTQHDTDAENHA